MGLAAMLVPLVAPAGAQPAPMSGQRTILHDVHTDVLDVRYIDGQLRLGTRAGNELPYQLYEASDVLFQLKDIDGVSRFPIPDDPQFAFLGQAGAPVWIAPQDFVSPLIYAGWDTEGILPGTLAGDAVDIRLVSVDGPGTVEVFLTDAAPVRVFSSRDPNVRVRHQEVAGHVHANWAFSALGRYTLTFEATGADPSGRPLSSGPVAYTWYVGGTQPGDVPAEPPPTTSTTTTTGTSTSTTTTGASPPGTSSPATTTTTSCVPVARQQPAAGGAVVLGDGHVDYAARILGGAMTSAVKDGTVAGRTTWREPGRVVFHVVPAAATTVPDSGFDFLGRPGDRIWQIPQTQRAGILWLGWNTEEIAATQLRGGITWSLDRVEGPGSVAVFLYDSFGRPKIVFNTGDGAGDRYEVPVGTHAHGNWAFTKEGVYRVTFTHAATLASGMQVRDTEVVTFAVGAVDPRSALPTGADDGGGNCPGGLSASRLAVTGASPAKPVAVGGLLVLAGALLLVVARRRRSIVDGER